MALTLAYLKSLFNKKQRLRMLRAMPVTRSFRQKNLAQSPAGSVEVNMGDKVDGSVVLSINPVASLSADGAARDSIVDFGGSVDQPKVVAVHD